jgi:hypothetical protein
VGEVRIAVDAVTSFPLRVQVTARGAGEPAFSSGFTSITYATPAPDVFAFTPPPGATVTEVDHADLATMLWQHQDAAAAPTVVGDGWSSVLVLRGTGSASTTGTDDAAAQSLLDAFVPVQGRFGTGRVLTTSLVSVLSLDDGRLLVGAVAPDVLERAALDPAAAVTPPP